MKKKLSIVFAVIMMLSFSGCAKVIALTENEENLIAQYASYTMIKHSRYNDSLLLSKEDLLKAEQREEEYKKKAEEKKQQSETDKNKDDKNSSEGQNSGTSNSTSTTTIGDPVTLSDAIGIKGLEFTYQGHDVLDEYSESIVTLGDRAGKKYVFLNFTLSNTSGENKTIDKITAKAKFKATINGSTVAHLPTLLPSDLATFNKKTVISAGAKKNVFIVFEVSDDTAKEIKSLSLSMTKDGNAGAVAIKLS